MRARNNTTKNRKNIHCTLVAAERDDPQNANKTAHQIMIEAFNKHYRAAESLAGWSPRMLITKAEVTRYGLVNWESSMQFGWQDTAPHEGFKLVGYAPTDSAEGRFVIEHFDRSIKTIGFIGLDQPDQLAIVCKAA